MTSLPTPHPALAFGSELGHHHPSDACPQGLRAQRVVGDPLEQQRRGEVKSLAILLIPAGQD